MTRSSHVHNVGAICTYAATWMVDEDADIIEVEMIRNSRGWIALGFSDDNSMASLSHSINIYTI